jgi:hypothetical protein
MRRVGANYLVEVSDCPAALCFIIGDLDAERGFNLFD